MKVTIRTLQQKTFFIDAEPSETVADLKSKIASNQGHAVDTQKLIYSGKVLSDDTTVEKLNLEDKKFIVLMTSKPKATPAASSSSTSAAKAPEPTPAAAPAPVPAAEPTPAPAAPAATPAAQAAATPAADRPFGSTSSFLQGPELQQTIQNMVEMGFERAQVMRALRASFNNPDRAVEYLMTGIPEHLLAETAPPPAQPAAAAPAAVPAAATPAAPAPATTNAPQNLFQLAHQQHQQQAPQHGVPGIGIPGLGGLGAAGAGAGAGGDRMAGLREMLAQNPAAMQPMIQQLAAANPQLAEQLANNPEALMQILNQIDGEGGFEGDEGGIPQGAIPIEAEDRPAIERLVALGFTPARAAQAYFAFDKNEELAANFLFETPDEDED
ncbi:UV excision repair protein Rad23 [Schizopora paradoxa]|uniref:UV excision repair protein RAD23 n=1 Tax=Schizopora paradoxa TaxID=27342 RepID=A0A0H2RS25_9AGAM|nr:UV excision repair protein Rad23 [Schizopora paradoxa]